MKSNQKLPELFKKLVDDGATEQEVADFLGKIREPDAAAELHEVMEEHWNFILSDDTSSQEPAREKSSFPTLLIASIAALICGVFVSFYLWSGADIAPRPDRKYDFVSRAAGKSKTEIVMLNDGSRVILNSGAVLRYPLKFDGDKREVFLEGEAYFDIKHESARSFLVHTGKLTTSVLGTTFNIMAYKELSKIAVTVISGKVAVKDTSNAEMVMLTPGRRAEMRNNHKSFVCDSVYNPADAIAWQRGDLVFDDTPLEEIALKLYYRFGTQIIIQNEAKRQMKFSGSFKTQDLPDILAAIAEISGVKLKIRNNNYMLY
jgi:ferric-dicitrate binding protein FerR (iron transport regulator)